jgi:threonine dehydrogenase-like Zn-dependent dehydrogenase
VIAAKRLGAEQIMLLGRHPDRIALAREFGATEIVSERGEEAVERVRELTDGYGAHSVLECVGLDQSTQTAIEIARPGGAVGSVGVPQDEAMPASSRRSSTTSRSAAAQPPFAPTSRNSCRTSSKAGSSRDASSTASSASTRPPTAIAR